MDVARTALLGTVLALALAGCKTGESGDFGSPISFHFEEANCYIGFLESVKVDRTPLHEIDPKELPERPQVIEILVNLDPGEVPRFRGMRTGSQFHLRSMKQSLVMPVSLVRMEDGQRPVFQCNPAMGLSSMGTGRSAKDGTLREVTQCLRVWSEGEKCLLELKESRNSGSVVSSPGGGG